MGSQSSQTTIGQVGEFLRVLGGSSHYDGLQPWHLQFVIERGTDAVCGIRRLINTLLLRDFLSEMQVPKQFPLEEVKVCSGYYRILLFGEGGYAIYRGYGSRPPLYVVHPQEERVLLDFFIGVNGITIVPDALIKKFGRDVKYSPYTDIRAYAQGIRESGVLKDFLSDSLDTKRGIFPPTLLGDAEIPMEPEFFWALDDAPYAQLKLPREEWGIVK